MTTENRPSIPFPTAEQNTLRGSGLDTRSVHFPLPSQKMFSFSFTVSPIAQYLEHNFRRYLLASLSLPVTLDQGTTREQTLISRIWNTDNRVSSFHTLSYHSEISLVCEKLCFNLNEIHIQNSMNFESGCVSKLLHKATKISDYR